MKLTEAAYTALLCGFPAVPPEAGALLGSGDGGNTITEVFLDLGHPQYDRAVYRPDTVRLNRALQDFARRGIRFCGIAHSHPPGQESLSQADLRYIERVMAAMPEEIERLYFPIVLPFERILPFAVSKRTGLAQEALELITGSL